MSFPKTIPAFTVKIPITAPSAIGTAKSGSLNQVAFLVDHPGGGITTEPGYPIQLDAKWVHGSDFIRADPDGKHLRLSVNSVLQQRDDPSAMLSFSYTGIIQLGGAADKVLSGAADAKTTDFGEVFSHHTFETGHPSLRALESKVFVGAGHFVLEAGQPPVVEYKISEVTL
ncbi:hypothetical protein CMQ_153 [Grosmannia clavigera kw1407]|uniref:Uncharacterized protein n=1 Tax=Grosmannia clavigera (strain kw1407 / UAMH 11150) TaxID=655863 RepID=F0XRI5_GROCL|nr:uncharacterized protein CMQ_153 [Grosmannia clavigera kw1407]EFW99835.1 hypothetical protein CMQ_153 [Grosmannia clavigera kw1407]